MSIIRSPVNPLSRGSFGYNIIQGNETETGYYSITLCNFAYIIIYALFDATVEVSVECYKLKRYLVVIKWIIYTSVNYLFEVNSKQDIKVITKTVTNTAIVNTAKIIHPDLTLPVT